MASTFIFRPANECIYDAISLGEVMMRIDPGDVPTAWARTAYIRHGGGEINVAEGLASAFRMRTAVVTALVDDGIGRNIEKQLNEARVNTDHIIWFRNDGTGPHATDAKGTLHNGIHFTWRGKGVLPSVTEYYRAHTPVSTLKPGEVDWDRLFGQGVRWFHSGGIFTLIGPQTCDLALEAYRAAGTHGVFRSYDLNYRSKVEPDKNRARDINRKIAAEAEFLVGFDDALGYDVKRVAEDEPLDAFLDKNSEIVRQVAKDFPNLKLIGTQLRSALSADLIHWGAVLYDVTTDTFYQATIRKYVEITDRTGGGDCFCSGIAAALMNGKTIEEAVEYGAAHGIIGQEFPGDTTMATEAMIEAEIARAHQSGGVTASR